MTKEEIQKELKRAYTNVHKGGVCKCCDNLAKIEQLEYEMLKFALEESN